MTVQRHDHAVDPLTEIGAQMLAEFEKCVGTIKNARAIVLVSVDGNGGIAMAGYEDDKAQAQAAIDLFQHMRAILRAQGKDVAIFTAEELRGAAAASSTRVLTKEERRVVVDALRAAAAATRATKSKALVDPHRAFSGTQREHVDHLARLAATQDKLAAELNEVDVRLERLVS